MVTAMSETGCGFQRAEDRHDPEWFCVVHLCWSSTTDLCPLQRAEAALRRVRELRDRFRDHEKWVSYRNVETLLTHALEGDA